MIPGTTGRRGRRATAHGTNSCYARGCRLPECREAHRVYTAQWRAQTGKRYPNRPGYDRDAKARLRARIEAGDPSVRHGSSRTYDCGCRCEPCLTVGRAAAAERARRYRQRNKTRGAA